MLYYIRRLPAWPLITLGGIFIFVGIALIEFGAWVGDVDISDFKG